jgi:pantoate--beta-alanine ligase
LHPGHISLIRKASEKGSFVLCSIFVNPTQFNNADDLKFYPVTLEKDIELLLQAGCDVLFLPSKEEIYPAHYRPKKYDLGVLETVLEGKYRPGHFQGVCQVVDRLLQIVGDCHMYLGQKDFQQCKVIQKLIDVTDRTNQVGLEIIPTVRESDGLAMSSRNLRLSPIQRRKAPALYEALRLTQANLRNKSLTELKGWATGDLEEKGFKVDYFEIADSVSLLPAVNIEKKVVALVAAHLDNVRLIDNLPLN